MLSRGHLRFEISDRSLVFDAGDKLVKAVELTKKLTLDKSWKGAIKLVSAMKLPALAERLSTMYEVMLILSELHSSLLIN